LKEVNIQQVEWEGVCLSVCLPVCLAGWLTIRTDVGVTNVLLLFAVDGVLVV